ncbi:SixA phosphatase family protein [Antrihabitans spumae]|jgi:phosphohistidine phosphatase|uniref:SixA phosphatase family protein n=1 Tax=Antrihabitans spumae TaxID=3373370 RepID=A0ABW7K039_9NOCA
MTRRVLILMRHGKSAYPTGIGDHERPLAPRGQREAALAGDWLREHQPPVDGILCSTSLRTRETLIATKLDAPTRFDETIYGASPHQLIDLVHGVDDAVSTLLILGHAPGMPYTTWELASNRSSPPAEQVSKKFPTSALAILEFDLPWYQLDTGLAELVAFHIPR